MIQSLYMTKSVLLGGRKLTVLSACMSNVLKCIEIDFEKKIFITPSMKALIPFNLIKLLLI